jgi:hypothetical protein
VNALACNQSFTCSDVMADYAVFNWTGSDLAVYGAKRGKWVLIEYREISDVFEVC